MNANNLETMTSKIYLKVFIALLILTALTISQPYLMGNVLSQIIPIQMFIAILKTVLIISYYMHLKYESKLFRMIALMAFITLSIFFIITAFDAIYRNETFDMFQGE